MKIEKVSSSQIKVYLSGKDLEERNLKLAELAYSSDKTRELFRELMEMAIEEYGFSADNIPLMIEAVPVNGDEVVLIVSKVSSDEDKELNISMIPSAFGERAFVKKTVEDMPQEISAEEMDYLVYSFESLDDVSGLCSRIRNAFDGYSSLYKYKGSYYLIITNDFMSELSAEGFGMIASEYGIKHISSPVTKAYLEEYGEVIIAKNAVEVMADI